MVDEMSFLNKDTLYTTWRTFRAVLQTCPEIKNVHTSHSSVPKSASAKSKLPMFKHSETASTHILPPITQTGP